MQKKFMPILAVSGALSLSLVAVPGSALAADNPEPSKDEQALVQHMNEAAQEQLTKESGDSSSAKASDKTDANKKDPAAASAEPTGTASATGSKTAGDAKPVSGTGAQSSTGTAESADTKPVAKADKNPATGTEAKPSAKDKAGKDAKKSAAEKKAEAKKAKEAAEKKAKAKKAREAAAKRKAAKEKAAKEKAAQERLAKKKAAEAKRKAAAKKAKAEKAAEATNEAKLSRAKHARAAAPAPAHAAPAPAATSASSANSAGSPSATSSANSAGSSSKSYRRVHYSQSMSTSMFVASIAEQARQIAQKYNLYASVMIAQAILESGSGSSVLSKAPNNNLFGIKGAYKGKSVKMATQEDNGSGSLYTIADNFRRYDTQRQSMKDYAKLLRNGSLYAGAWKENTDSYKDATAALQGRYATDTSYAAKLNGLIKTYDLTRFDKKLDFKITGTKETKDGQTKKLTMGDYANLEALATSVLGTDYVWGGNTTKGFDCSGLVQWLYKNALGINLTRTTYTQQHEGKKVDFDHLQMGDLLFFQRGSDTYHVAMYLGDGFYIHAPNVGDVVKIGDMESFTPSFAKRIITTTPVKNSTAKAKKVAQQKEAANIK